MENISLQWQAPEYEERERSADWYWAVSIIALSIASASFVFDNFLFAVLIIIGAFTLMVFAKRKPSILDAELNQRGLQINKTLYLFNELESFYIEDMNPDRPLLILKSKKHLMPLIVMPIKEIDPEDIRAHMSQNLPEKQHMEPLSHKIMDYLGF